MSIYDHLPPPRTTTLLLSCMDYRLIKYIHDYMTKRHLQDDYNHIVLAGGAAAVVSGERPAWAKIFWDHLEISITMHQIKRVIILDHRHCAGHRLMLGEAVEKDRTSETESHRQQLVNLKNKILEQYQNLTVELGLMELDGAVEVIE